MKWRRENQVHQYPGTSNRKSIVFREQAVQAARKQATELKWL